METGGSILESVGSEIIGVMSPVSICMFLVVLLVYSLSSSSSPPSDIRTAANLVYLESPTDSTTEKLEGALENAVVFVILIALVTFLLVLLYYYRCTKFLINYTRFSSFFVLSFMGGPIFLTIIQHFSIPIDSITCFVLLFNFSVLGVLSIFSNGVPILIRQSYMVCLGIIVAAWFTRLPEWTSWALLVALALYDLVAVLAPGGPLKLLVELASSREEELPALVYESRPSTNSSLPVSILAGIVGNVEQSSGNEYSSVELQRMSNNEIEIEEDIVRDDGEEERSPLMAEGSREREEAVVEHGDEMVTIIDRGIKLGLGDFVFYSVLVGRAAMYDLMTVYACYLAIISGLGCTLILLAVCRQALPALPISIALGIIFYFLTRLLMEPFVVGTATNLIMF